jgi:serine phosphatase RsbU (regulator of sigma subunit)
MFGALVVIGVTGWVINRMAFTYVVSEAYAQLVRRDLLQQNENLIKENLEKDLYLAREVQDSFLPPAGGLKLPEGYVAKFFKSNSHTLGGDWMAYRMVGDHTLVAMILDATGKGTAAALVVHAVQSLWVKSLSQTKFDIETWIQGVNRTLGNFGHKSVHSITMGVVAYRPGEDLTYYSCGHVPIFIMSSSHRDTDGKVVSMTGGGDILGLKPNCNIGVAKFAGDINGIRSIFLGTDGIFPQGTRTNRRFVMALEEHLVKQDESYLSAIESKDDKLLLWIHREAS